ncbi:MAG: sugar phosphate nucleotidyltransferase [Crocinitomicaceae bacterium]|nr:sugar phosphate nucleotidyltransferase [Crocinitomicaceae bacterium]
MKLIIPMAGRGSRLRPHTLTVPKPLVPVGGKPIVHRLVEDLAASCPEKIDEIGFIIGDFGKEVETELLAIAAQLGAKGSIHYQTEPLGTAHAVLCAKELLTGPVTIAFADTLFKANFKIDATDEGILYVSQIEDPSAFGVVKMNETGEIVDFVEKPQTFVSDLAMIGIYYFKKGEDLLTELNYLIDNDVIKSGEYQLPDALRRLTGKGVKFKPGKVEEWLDCGNKAVTVHTNQRVLEYDKAAGKKMKADSAQVSDSIIHEPCFIGENVIIDNSIIGPHVSLGKGTKVVNSIVVNTNVQNETEILNAILKDSMIGSKVKYIGKVNDISLGDFSTME